MPLIILPPIRNREHRAYSSLKRKIENSVNLSSQQSQEDSSSPLWYLLQEIRRAWDEINIEGNDDSFFQWLEPNNYHRRK